MQAKKLITASLPGNVCQYERFNPNITRKGYSSLQTQCSRRGIPSLIEARVIGESRRSTEAFGGGWRDTMRTLIDYRVDNSPLEGYTISIVEGLGIST